MEEKPNFSRFRNSEHLQFFENVHSICQKVDVVAINIETQVNDLAQATLNLSKNFKQKQGSEYTLSLSQLDHLRDSAIKLLRKVASAYTSHYDEDKAKAARLVLRTIDKYGKAIYKLHYQEESITLKNLGKDLKEQEGADAVALLGLTDVVDHMISVNDQFNEQYLNRVGEKAESDDVATAELIKEAVNKYNVLEDYIQANKVLNPSDELSSLIKKLEELIDGLNNTVSSRSKKADVEVE